MLICLQCERFCFDDASGCGLPRCGLPECEFVDIDELAIPWIIELNKKGYKTQFCCSGHIYEVGVFTYCRSIPISGNDVIRLFQIVNDNTTYKQHFKIYIFSNKIIDDVTFKSSCELNEVTNDGVYEVQLELKDDFVFKDQEDYLYKLDCIYNANKLFYNLAKSLPYFNEVK